MQTLEVADHPRRRKSRLAVWSLVWLTGTWTFIALVPAEPIARWLPASEERVIGFIRDNRTVVTSPIVPGPPDPFNSLLPPALRVNWSYCGPIHLWNFETGNVRTLEYRCPTGFDQVRLTARKDRLQIVQRISPGGPDGRHWLSLVDPEPGETVSKFICNDFGKPTWVVSEDGKTSAYETESSAGQRSVICHELPWCRRLAELRDCFGPLCLSSDGKLVAALAWSQAAIVIFDLREGRCLARIATLWKSRPSPRQFSADGRWLLDSDSTVWEIGTGKAILQRKPMFGSSGCEFGADGKTLRRINILDETILPSTIEIASGRELANNGTGFAQLSPHHSVSIDAHSRGDRWLVGYSMEREERRWEKWLSRLTGKSTPSDRLVDEQALVADFPSKRVLQRVAGATADLSLDGNLLARSSKMDGVEVWRVPAERAWSTILTYVSVWSLALTGVRIWWNRRRKTAECLP